MFLDAPSFVDYWRNVRARTIRVLDHIPPSDLEWTHTPGKYTFGDVFRHLAGIERYMYGETVQGRPSRYAGHGRDLADGFDDVMAYYDRLHEGSKDIFASLSDAQLAGKCMTPAGTPITTWKWLRAMFEHEAHHRGQVYMMLAIRGVKTPPLYGLTEEEVVARSQPG